MTVRIVTDSVADLSPKVAEELGITIVPLNVCFGTEVYHDGIDLTTEQFYDRLVHSEILPVTSAPSLGAFAATYDRLAEETDGIITITVSSKLSATYEMALQGRGLMKKKCRVEVLDSQWAIMAQGFLAIAAARAAQAGAKLDELVSSVQSNIPRVDFHAAFDTLEYLKKGGRIGKAQAFLGSMLKINPIITLKDGVIKPVGKARSRTKAIERLCDFVASYSNIEEMAVENGACPADAELLVQRISSKFPKERIYRSKTTPVIGTHTGPGFLGVAILGDK